jgi:excisionase family DNA binding protein
MDDYSNRDYLSTTEVATYLGIKAHDVVVWIDARALPATKSAGGQHRVRLENVKHIENKLKFPQTSMYKIHQDQ